MKFVKPLVKIAISVVLITIVLRTFDVRGVVAHFAKVDVTTLLMAVALALAIALLHTLRWLAVVTANGSKLSFKTALQVVLIGHFLRMELA